MDSTSWERPILYHFANQTCPEPLHAYRAQWIGAFSWLTESFLTYDEVVALIVYSVACMDHDEILSVSETERNAHLAKTHARYNMVMRRAWKRLREEGDESNPKKKERYES